MLKHNIEDFITYLLVFPDILIYTYSVSYNPFITVYNVKVYCNEIKLL